MRSRTSLCNCFYTSWNTWQAPLALRSRIAEARAPPTCCLATPTRIGEIAVHGDRRLVRSCCTTRRRSGGDRRCRSLLLSQRQRLSTIPLVLRSCTRALLERLGSLRRCPHQCKDNAACIKWGNNVISGRERAKHIDIRKHLAHEVIRNGERQLIKVSTTSQLADILTKGLHM
jgi:hypothetical protein